MALSDFKEKLLGWMTDPDGKDHCRGCWNKHLKDLEENQSENFLSDFLERSQPTVKFADSRKAYNGWYVRCYHCSRRVSASYTDEEQQAYLKSIRKRRQEIQARQDSPS